MTMGKSQRYHRGMPAKTLKALYRETTGDLVTQQRTVDASFRKLDPRWQRMIRARLEGQSYHKIAATHGITAASVRDTILRAPEAARKAAHREPRYNRSGRRHHVSVGV